MSIIPSFNCTIIASSISIGWVSIITITISYYHHSSISALITSNTCLSWTSRSAFVSAFDWTIFISAITINIVAIISVTKGCVYNYSISSSVFTSTCRSWSSKRSCPAWLYCSSRWTTITIIGVVVITIAMGRVEDNSIPSSFSHSCIIKSVNCVSRSTNCTFSEKRSRLALQTVRDSTGSCANIYCDLKN